MHDEEIEREDDIQVNLTADYMHEALDRAYLVGSIFDEHVLGHPAVAGTPELRKLAESISEALGGFYQACSNAMFDFERLEKDNDMDTV